MGTLTFALSGQSLADLAGEFIAEEWNDAYRQNYSLCNELADEKGAGPTRISRDEWEKREFGHSTLYCIVTMGK